MGLGLRGARSLVFACVACSAASVAPAPPLQKVLSEQPVSAEVGSVRQVAGEPWPDESRLFLMTTARQELQLRAAGSDFVYRLASSARHVLYDPAFELVWFSDDQKLWVIDLREPSPRTLTPVLIASELPPHVEIHVERAGASSVEPVDACDMAPILFLHWEAEPWLEADQGQRSGALPGKTWLARERGRAARAVGAERWLHPSDAHVALPPARARCEDAAWCGASQSVPGTGWELVLTEQSEGGDCWHFGCLARDSSKGLFGTPPHPQQWGPADEMPSGPCGPYRFDAAGGSFLVHDRLCLAEAGCSPLDGWAVGWLVPGVTLGAPG